MKKQMQIIDAPQKIGGLQLRLIWPQDREVYRWPYDIKWANLPTENFFASYTSKIKEIKSNHPRTLLKMNHHDIIRLQKLNVYRETIHGQTLEANGLYKILSKANKKIRIYDNESNKEKNLESCVYLICPRMNIDGGSLPEDFSMKRLDFYIVKECALNPSSKHEDISKMMCRGEYKERFGATPSYILRRMYEMGIILFTDKKLDYKKIQTIAEKQ